MNKTKILTTVIIVLAISTGILGINSVIAEEGKIPAWIKVLLGYYVQGDITDTELLNALEFLIDNGILKVGEQTYEPFSKDQFPATGGFNPAWLEDERALILQTCKESRTIGYEDTYCQYVR